MWTMKYELFEAMSNVQLTLAKFYEPAAALQVTYPDVPTKNWS